MSSDGLLAEIDVVNGFLAQVTTVNEARKLLVMAESITSVASKVYWSVEKVAECKEDRDHAHGIAVKAGEIKLRVEARLGELISSEQKAGRLATQESGKPKDKCNNGVTHTSSLKDVGLSRMDSVRAKLVASHVDLIPLVVEEAREKGDVPTRQSLEKKVKMLNQDERRREQIEKIEKLPSPMGKYQVIVVDPPWSYEKRVDDVSHRGRSPYPTMSLEEIIAKSPPCCDDCIVWLWTTNAFMHDAFHVLEAWDLEAKTILTWKKSKIGLGDWLRGQTEHCILAVKGYPIVSLSNQSTFLEGELREHSRKPDSFYRLVEELCHGSKYEMYGREEREGWIVSGDLEFKQ